MYFGDISTRNHFQPTTENFSGNPTVLFEKLIDVAIKFLIEELTTLNLNSCVSQKLVGWCWQIGIWSAKCGNKWRDGKKTKQTGVYVSKFPNPRKKKSHWKWISIARNHLFRIKIYQTYIWNKPQILLMQEILHQLIGSLSHYLRVLYIPGGAGFFPSTVFQLWHWLTQACRIVATFLARGTKAAIPSCRCGSLETHAMVIALRWKWT